MEPNLTETRYPEKLCEALMSFFKDGAQDLDQLTSRLNKDSFKPLKGKTWTTKLLSKELQRLGCPPQKVNRPAAVQLETKSKLTYTPSEKSSKISYSELVDDLLAYGVRNQWYGIAASSEVTDKPCALTRLGEKIVVWRGKNGEVHALEDRCPHRGLALSIGEVEENNIRCSYHGIQVDGKGTVVDVPAFTDCPFVGKNLVKSYPTFEHYQMIWAYFGDEAHPEPPPLHLPEELVDENWSGALHTADWDGHYQYVYDNLADPMHGAYLHGMTYMQSGGSKSDRMKIEDTGHGFEFFRAGQANTSFDWMEFIDADTSKFVRAKIAFPPTGGPGGPLCIVFYTTPINKEKTRIFAYRFRQVSGWQADLYHFMYKNRFQKHMDAVLGQDKMAIAAMPPWPPNENLYQHDIGLTRIRKHFRDEAEKQAKILTGSN